MLLLYCIVLYYVRELLSSTIAIATHRVRSSPPKTIRGVGALHCFCPLYGDATVVQRDLRSEGNCLSRG